MNTKVKKLKLSPKIDENIGHPFVSVSDLKSIIDEINKSRHN